MNYQKITFEVPALTDEAAAYLHKFIEALMYAVDEQYYKQIFRHHAGNLKNMLDENHLKCDKLDDPPF